MVLLVPSYRSMAYCGTDQANLRMIDQMDNTMTLVVREPMEMVVFAEKEIKMTETKMTAVKEIKMTEELTKEEIDAMVQNLVATLKRLKKENASCEDPTDVLKKNHKPSKPKAGRKYIMLGTKLEMWGKVPQQQQDLAAILIANLKVGIEYSEAEVFNPLTREAATYASINNSVQDPTYLFKYYRGLKNDGKYAGFVARGFLRVID